MTTTVSAAFNNFLEEKINLLSATTSRARTSRDWLLGKIDAFPDDGVFPDLYSGASIGFGSFARKTKKQPLDDIDYMIGLSAELGVYGTSYDGSIYIEVHESASRLLALTHEDGRKLNSRRVINKFVSKIGDIPQYGAAKIKRNGEAACVKPNSYEWNFDIVPSFITKEDADGKTFYLIPDGNGHWKKTDPRMDRDRVSRVNQNRDGKILNIIRLMKYWNRRPTMPSVPSYLFENMILDYYESHSATDYINFDVRNLFSHIHSAIFNSVYDPKGIEGDLNTLSWDDKSKIMTRALADYEKAQTAIAYETIDKDQRKAIAKWGEIFGPDFPSYG